MSVCYLEFANIGHIQNHLEKFGESRTPVSLELAVPTVCHNAITVWFSSQDSNIVLTYFDLLCNALGTISYQRHLMPSLFWILDALFMSLNMVGIFCMCRDFISLSIQECFTSTRFFFHKRNVICYSSYCCMVNVDLYWIESSYTFIVLLSLLLMNL